MADLVSIASGELALQDLHRELVLVVAHLHAALRSAVNESENPLAFKRVRVELPARAEEHSGIVIGQTSENYGELVNQLATMARLRDTAAILLDHDDSGSVVFCNPTTSNEGHDLEVRRNTGQDLVIEVNDVIKATNNGKVRRDLGRLAESRALRPAASHYLACSPDSARYMQGKSKVRADTGWTIENVWVWTGSDVDLHSEEQCKAHSTDDLPTHLVELRPLEQP